MVVCTLTWFAGEREVRDDNLEPLEPQIESETYGPFESEEAADEWERCLHPSVKSRPGYRAVISELFHPNVM